VNLLKKKIPESIFPHGGVKFSLLAPDTLVPSHVGPTNARLRMHLGVVCPPGTGMRVGENNMTWHEGEVLLFDDAYEHEVWNYGKKQRVILIVDVWHPYLQEKDRYQKIGISLAATLTNVW